MKKLVFVFILGYVSCAGVRNHITNAVAKRKSVCMSILNTLTFPSDSEVQEALSCIKKDNRFFTLEKVVGLISYNEQQ